MAPGDEATVQEGPLDDPNERFKREAKNQCLNAANSILVGAALIATITYATWILLPLTHVTDHKAVKAFWVLNTLSFYFAIFTVWLCVVAVWPYYGEIGRPLDFTPLRSRVRWAACFFVYSYYFVIAAYMSGAYVTVPKDVRFLDGDGYILVTCVVGITLCVVGIIIATCTGWGL